MNLAKCGAFALGMIWGAGLVLAVAATAIPLGAAWVWSRIQ